MTRVIVTGAAGFIASHLTDALLANGHEVLGIDNLSNGKVENLMIAKRSPRFSFLRFNLRNVIPSRLAGSVDTVFHFAADPEVRTGFDNPESQFGNNIIGDV